MERASVPHRKGRFGDGTPVKICIASCGQTVADSGTLSYGIIANPI